MNEEQQQPIYHLAPTPDGLTEDDVVAIVSSMLQNYTTPSKMSGSFFQSANFITGVQGWQLRPDGAEVNGSFSVTLLNIPNATSANSFHVDANGNVWWGASVASYLADPNNAPARVDNDGQAVFANILVTGGTIPASVITGLPPATVDISAQDWTYSGTFSSVSATIIAWSAGNLVFSDGTTYAIAAGTTGSMAAKTYIYINNAVSTTALQFTTNPATAVGNGKVLIAVAENDSSVATFVVLNDKSKQINASEIVAGSITGNKIQAGTITAGLLNVSQLSAISADLGAINAGSISINSGIASIDGSGNAVFKSIQVGDAARQYVISGNGIFSFGDGDDGDATCDGATSVAGMSRSGTTYTMTRDVYFQNLTIDAGVIVKPSGYRIFVSNLFTVNGAVTGNGNNGGNGGNGGTATLSAGGGGGTGGVAATALGAGYLNGAVGGFAGGGGGGGGQASGGTPGTAGSPGTGPSIPVTNALGSNGVNGVAGSAGGNTGASSGGAGGGAGSGGTVSASNVRLIANWHLATLLDISSSGSTVKFDNAAASAGSGGGGGGGSTPGFGSGGGGGGGGGGASGTPGRMMAIYAKKIVVGAAGVISVNGGSGGNGGVGGNGNNNGSGGFFAAQSGGGGGSGGSGGNGGQLILAYNEFTNSGTVTANGGLGGTGGTGGVRFVGNTGTSNDGTAGISGLTGTVGTIYEFQLSL